MRGPVLRKGAGDADVQSYATKATILMEFLPIGVLRFKLRVVARGQPHGEMTIHGDDLHRYRQAFLSYSTEDRAEVLKRAQALKAARIGFFQALLSLEPGERWERRLYEEIDRCDLFLLFWSSHAARSEWVTREAEYALKRSNASDDHMPDIAPIILEGPPIRTPPELIEGNPFQRPNCLCAVSD